MMKKLKEATVVLDERCAAGATSERRAGRSDEAAIAPSTSMIFMDAANNINVQDFSIENVREYTLRKFNVDVTKNIFDTQKPTTRAEIRAEQKRIDANKQARSESTQKDSAEAKRKFGPAFGNSVAGIKKNAVHEKISPYFSEREDSFNVQKEVGENAADPEDGSQMVKTAKAKRSYKKKVKENVISSKGRSEIQVDSTKKKRGGGRGKKIPVLLEGAELQRVREDAGENAENPRNETKLIKAANSKPKVSRKKMKPKKT